MSGVDEHWAGLSQDDIETLSEFRMEVNMHRARIGQEAIEVDEALKYLKATGFSAAKASEVIKNYMKHRENYQLDKLKPYRDPLSSEIGSRKLEIIGTQDSDGSPVALFTGSRHDMKSSEHKAAMQLLFYTLDQLAESEEAGQKGVVFIMDMRECSLDMRYINSFLSVLKDGYPLLIKRVYVVSAPFWMKGQVTVLKAWKQDNHKIKLLAFSDLSKHFTESQLPHSLGGTFVPNSVQQQSRPGNHGPTPMIPHHPKQSPSVPVKQSHSHNTSTPSSHGSAVNDLVSMFGGSGKTSPQTSTSQLHQITPAQKPTPPHKLKPPDQQHQVKGQSKTPLPVKLSFSTNSGSKVRPTPPPRVSPTNDEQTNSTSSDSKGAFKVPMLPPSVMKSSSPAKTTSSNSGPRRAVQSSPKATTPDKNPGGLGILARIKNFEHKQDSVDLSQPKTKPPLVKTASEEWPVEGKHTDFSTSWTVGATERRRSGSAGNSPKLQAKESPTRSRKARVPIKLRSPDTQEKKDHVVKEKVRQPMLPRSFQPQLSKEKEKSSAYENMEVPVSMVTATTITTNASPSLASFYNDDIYENVMVDRGPPPPVPTSNSRAHSSYPTESTAYENVTIQTPPPKPPAAHHTTHSSSLREDYENVTVLEDDEMLFGKEGPPGMQEVIYENFGPDEGCRLMSVHELEEHIKSKGKKGLSAEYYRIRNEPLTGLYEACRLPYNTSKNRYKDVVCYDVSRVSLNRLPGVDGSDYIHANYVNGYKKQNSFILTQGPKDKTVADFWRMIWEKQITIIVMITKCVELGKRKCSQYWPDSGSTTHGKVTVSVSDTDNCEGYDIRKLIVSCQGVERTVTQYQFLAWPDYGVPKNGSHVLNLLESVREARSKHSPMIVHCSAGVGRSGAFVALDNSINELQDLKKVNLQAAVRKIRLQRAYCIQTDEQYEFCYRTLLEYAKSVVK